MAMSREDAKKILGENATDEQVSSLLNVFHASEKTLKEEIAQKNEELKKYSDYDSIKSQLDEINKSKMSEQEKLEQDKQEIAKNLKESKLIVNTAKAKEILAGCNVNDTLLKSLVNEDETTTISNATELLNSFNALKDEVAKKTKEDLTNLNLKPNMNNSTNDDVMTFDKFRTLSTEEQNKFAEEHPEEFEKL